MTLLIEAMLWGKEGHMPKYLNRPPRDASATECRGDPDAGRDKKYCSPILINFVWHNVLYAFLVFLILWWTPCFSSSSLHPHHHHFSPRGIYHVTLGRRPRTLIYCSNKRAEGFEPVTDLSKKCQENLPINFNNLSILGYQSPKSLSSSNPTCSDFWFRSSSVLWSVWRQPSFEMTHSLPGVVYKTGPKPSVHLTSSLSGNEASDFARREMQWGKRGHQTSCQMLMMMPVMGSRLEVGVCCCRQRRRWRSDT